MKIKHTYSHHLGLCLTLGIPFLSATAFGQSTWDLSYTLASNNGYNNAVLDSAGSTTGALSVASSDISFTGMNRSGFQQTMRFIGETRTSAQFGRLRSYTTSTVTNAYNNPINPIYYNSNTGVTNPAGSPDTVTSLGFAGFNDVLHFGGVLEAGYRARYIFHVDGTNTGVGCLADMSFGIEGNPDESFFAQGLGFISENWVTQTYAINGITPQNVRVQFSNQVVADLFLFPDGSTISGTSNFSSTLTLAKIEVVDQNNNLVNGWTVTADSGTVYPVPEPSAIVAIVVGGLGLILRRKN